MALDALIVEHASEVDDGSRRQRGRRCLRWIGLIAAVALFAAALGIITSNEVQTDRQFDHTNRSLDVTRAHIRSVLGNLGTVQNELQGVNVQVFLTSKALAQDAADLKLAQTELANAQSDVSHQTMVITDLRTCLGGVQEALNALSVADQARAIDALNSVTPSCNDVVALNG
jgi:flagellin-like hook-associated protein FlgL